MKYPKTYSKLLPVVLIFVGILVYGHVAHANAISDFFLIAIGVIIAAIVNFLGWLVTLIMSAIIVIAQYQNYIYAAPVVMGWKIVRDICNMFFILIVLIIAFATILRIERYSIKQLLKKVIIAAILINFSKTICGLMIDAANVVMMTFVNGFKDMGGAQITQILGIDKMQELSNISNETGGTGLENQNSLDFDFWDIILVYCLALVYMLVAVVVLISMLGVLLMRMIMLWIYIIISPMAYLSSVLPATDGVTKKWLHQFTSYVVTGPILAFFIWLSIAVLSQTTNNNPSSVSQELLNLNANGTGIEAKAQSPITTTPFFVGYIVAIGLLVGGLIVSKEYGGVIGQSAGWGYGQIKRGAGWAKKQAIKPVKYAGQKAAQGAKAGAKAVGRGTVSLASKTAKGADEMFFNSRVSRGIGAVKDNLSMNGARKIKDYMAAKMGASNGQYGRFTSAPGHSEAAKISQSVAEHGFYHDQKNHVTYSKNSQGYITAGGKDFTDNKDDNEKLLPKIFVGNKPQAALLKPRSEKFAKFSKGWNSATTSIKNKAEKAKKDASEVEQFKKDYVGMSENELKSRYESTTSVARQKAIVRQAAESGFTEGFFGSLIKDLESEINFQKSNFNKYKLQADGGRNFYDNPDNKKIAGDFEGAEFDAANFNWENNKDVDGLGKKLAAHQVMKEKQIWDSYLETLTPEQAKMTEDVIAQMQSKQAEYGQVAEDHKQTARKNFERAQSLFKGQPGLMKDFMDATRKQRLDLGYDLENEAEAQAMEKDLKKGKVKLTDQKISHLDTKELAKILDRSLKALGRERYDAQVNLIDKDGSKEFANKMADASLILAKQAEVKATPKDLESAFAFRKDFVRLKGDIGKAFIKSNGSFDMTSMEKFFANASVKELSGVDASTMTDEQLKHAASAINFSKLNNLNSRQGDNPNLVNKLAQAMSDINHVEASKIPLGISNKFVINIEKINKNKVIQDVMRETPGIKGERITDYDFINKLRTDLEGLSGNAAINSGYYRRGKGDKLTATDMLRDEVKKRV